MIVIFILKTFIKNSLFLLSIILRPFFLIYSEYEGTVEKSREDMENWKKQRYCKKYGHLWEYGDHGKCLNGCGWNKDTGY